MKRSYLILFLALIGIGLFLVLAALSRDRSVHPAVGLLPPSSQPSYRIRWKGADTGYESETLVYPDGARREAPASRPSESSP